MNDSVLSHRRYDLHTHTTASDGMLSPESLVQRAVEMKVDVLAITDHDTLAGLIEAEDTILRQQLPLTLIPGVEISTLWDNLEIHVVGLNFDPANPDLIALLARQGVLRRQRAEEIAARLADKNIPDALAVVQRLAGDGAITRGHFARYLVEIGAASSINKVFDKYLSRGKIGYVPAKWVSMDEGISAIKQAGGMAVLAHPTRYKLSNKGLKHLLADFKQMQGDAIEVAQCQQSNDQRKQLTHYALDYQFLASQGSDFHQPSAWRELGRNLWLPTGLQPVWHDWDK